MDAVFSLPDLEPLMGPLDKVARDAVLTSLRRCQPLVLEPLPVDPATISVAHFDYRPDCLLLDDIEGDVGASTPLEREATKKWFFGTVLPSLASRSIIRMAVTPLDQECLPVTLGKMPTWKTMVVPVRSISGGEDAFFESWLAEQGVELGSDAVERTAGNCLEEAAEDELRDKVKQFIAAQNRPVASSSIEELPHVVEERPPAKSFDLVHPAISEQVENDGGDASVPEGLGPDRGVPESAPKKVYGRQHKRVGQAIPEAKSTTPTPTPVPAPESQREMTEIERAMRFSFPKDRR